MGQMISCHNKRSNFALYLCFALGGNRRHHIYDFQNRCHYERLSRRTTHICTFLPSSKFLFAVWASDADSESKSFDPIVFSKFTIKAKHLHIFAGYFSTGIACVYRHTALSRIADFFAYFTLHLLNDHYLLNNRCTNNRA